MLRNEVSRKLAPDLIKATQAILCVRQKLGINLWTWSQGVDRDNNEVLIFIPEETLHFYDSTEFLKCLRDTWVKSGLHIIEESVGNTYNCVRGVVPSLCFRLRAD